MPVMILGTNITEFIFVFFGIGIGGWVVESINETIIRKKFVNKGFFKGPFVLVQAVGGVCVYAIGLPFKAYPLLVFFFGLFVCTAIEYVTALFLKKFFKVKCWDYRTYPLTKWCHFQGRIALTVSLSFGFVTLFLVYIYWNLMLNIAAIIGKYLLIVDIVLCALFLLDIVFTCTRVLKAKKTGEKIKGYAVFSDIEEAQ